MNDSLIYVGTEMLEGARAVPPKKEKEEKADASNQQDIEAAMNDSIIYVGTEMLEGACAAPPKEEKKEEADASNGPDISADSGSSFGEPSKDYTAELKLLYFGHASVIGVEGNRLEENRSEGNRLDEIKGESNDQSIEEKVDVSAIEKVKKQIDF
ncbi:uncharacterized protein LOC129573210 isoform X2 [Sitodiplosis mosellana]|uniref:uncharacterized protein LOC129573210 isoform X2 n=1 Tax=Sitodiplosis mosellana TaxID=263140 RepID=UPI0024444935|nr:uncharacterized protein LOC129573210 isoform X2 [Sitodiplosis mosellana]